MPQCASIQQIVSLQYNYTSAAFSILVPIWNNQVCTVLISAALWIVQVESSREANTQALQELSAKLQQEYEEKLLEEQRKHREEIENLQVCILYCLFNRFLHGTSHIVSMLVETKTCLSQEQERCVMITQDVSNAFGFDTLQKDNDAECPWLGSSIRLKWKCWLNRKWRSFTTLLITWWAVLKAVQHLNRNVFLFSQAQLDEYIRRLEEAESNIRIAEAKIAERDQRIIEVERLLDCMDKVRKSLT